MLKFSPSIRCFSCQIVVKKKKKSNIPPSAITVLHYIRTHYYGIQYRLYSIMVIGQGGMIY